jgi:hypothetical protein
VVGVGREEMGRQGELGAGRGVGEGGSGGGWKVGVLFFPGSAGYSASYKWYPCLFLQFSLFLFRRGDTWSHLAAAPLRRCAVWRLWFFTGDFTRSRDAAVSQICVRRSGHQIWVEATRQELSVSLCTMLEITITN